MGLCALGLRALRLRARGLSAVRSGVSWTGPGRCRTFHTQSHLPNTAGWTWSSRLCPAITTKLNVPSAQSGATHYPNPPKNTAFGATFNCKAVRLEGLAQ